MKAVDEIKKILEEELDFGKYQTNVLTFLIKQPNYLTAKQISEGCGVPIFRIYSILDTLEEKGLVKTAPGKSKLFLISDADRINELILIAKEKEMKEKGMLLEKACMRLKKRLSEVSLSEGSEIIASYYVRPEDYWPVKAYTMDELKENDSVKLIETNLPFFCFLGDKFLEPYFESYVLKARKAIRRTKLPWGMFINPDILVGATAQRFKANKKQVIKELVKILEFCKFNRNKVRIKCMSDIQNFTLSTVHDSVFIEFYPPYGLVPDFFIALKIKNKKVSDIFSNWLDMQFMPGEYDSLKEFGHIKSEILKYAKQIINIKPEEIESKLR